MSKFSIGLSALNDNFSYGVALHNHISPQVLAEDVDMNDKEDQLELIEVAKTLA